MERSSYAWITGIFIAVFSVVILATVFIFGRDRHSPTPYRLHTTIPVYGLHEGAKVKMNGIEVGRVASVGFSKEESGFIDVVMEINEGAPIMTGTVAAVDQHPVTGIASVNLMNDGDNTTLLKSSEESPAEIPVVPGNIGVVKVRGMEIMAEVQAVTASLAVMFDDADHRAIYKMLCDLNRRSRDWAETPVKIGRVALDVPDAVHGGHDFFQKMNALAPEVKKVSKIIDKRMSEKLDSDELERLEDLADRTKQIMKGMNDAMTSFRQGRHPVLTKSRRVVGPGEK